MTTFDPAAATAAYLAELSPAAHAKAVAYTQGGHWLLLWGWLVTIVASWLIIRSGILAKTGQGIERRKPHPVIVSFVLSLIYLVADWVLELPWASYSEWWREKQYGLSNQTWLGWFGDDAKTTLVVLIVVALFLAGIYALIRHAGRAWPVWAGLLTGAFLVFTAWAQPVVLDPLLNTYEAAPPGAVRDTVVALGHATGVPTDKIYVFNGSKQSNRYTANVAGMFGTARVALSDSMFAKGADIAQIRGVVGHEMGHYVHQHALWDAAASAILVMLGAWLLQALFPLASTLFGAGGLGGLSDPAGLPVLMAIFATLSLLATPINNTISRLAEADADSFSLAHAGEPDGLSEALVKTIEYRASSPSDLEEVLFYDHPSVEHRVRKAMDWKAAHMPAATAPAVAASSAPTPAGH